MKRIIDYTKIMNAKRIRRRDKREIISMGTPNHYPKWKGKLIKKLKLRILIIAYLQKDGKEVIKNPRPLQVNEIEFKKILMRTLDDEETKELKKLDTIVRIS